uniref:Reverse transcriptase Ty1/copia-type domain-containing protein n=1 Tax=Physcomitrium patens TaxID=3218 RepID=A0A2K1KWR5_PHYPA|nr:hypothetical protein PHYPA_005185 [Physcomitrium patens]
MKNHLYYDDDGGYQILNLLCIKLHNKTYECILLGYTFFSKRYKIQRITNEPTYIDYGPMFLICPLSPSTMVDLNGQSCFFLVQVFVLLLIVPFDPPQIPFGNLDIPLAKLPSHHLGNLFAKHPFNSIEIPSSLNALDSHELIINDSYEAEYMAMATAELAWLQHLLHDLSLFETLTTPMVIYCDNQSALALVDTTKFHSRTKHIDIRHHFIRQLSALNKVLFRYCSTHDIMTNLFTKLLCGPKLA